MTIIHVVEPFAAGIAVFVKSLTETMPDDKHIIVHGERKHVMKAEAVKKIFPQNNIHFIRWQSAQRSINPLKDLFALRQLYLIVKRLKQKQLVDVVHLHSSKSGLLGRLACRMVGISNVIYTPNGAPFLSGGNSISKFIYRELEKFGHGLGGKIVCCSASELREYEKIGINGSYVNNGIAMPEAETEFVKKESSKFRIITSGRIVDQKNPALFNAIASYFQEFKDFEFIWAGDGDEREALTAKNITVTGWLNEQQVKALMKSADVYLSTSLYEGLSFAVLEALALKKTMLLSECVGNTDVVKNGMNGHLFTSDEEAITKILSFYNNREMLQLMGEFSHQICAEQFDAQQNFQLYRNVYSGNDIKLTKPQGLN